MLRLSACLCFKDSASYLDEWLLFHRAQGVEHFHLYDNESSDDFRTVLDPWIDSGLVTLTHWRGAGQQLAIYDHCLGVARETTRWLAFIDDDEFLHCPSGASLADTLEDYAEFAGVGACWVLFGSGGIARREPGWVIERFTRRADFVDQHIKCIVQPRHVVRSLVGGHLFETRPGRAIVDEKRQVMTSPFNPQPTADVLRYNHYLVKSWEEFLPRRTRPQVNTGAPSPHPMESWRAWDQEWSRVADTRLAALRAHCESFRPRRGPVARS